MYIKIEYSLGKSLKTFEHSDNFPISIGRAAGCHLRIPDQPQYRRVARHHADIFVMQKAFHLRNLSETNGIYFEEQRLKYREEAALQIGDKFRLGPIEMRIVDIEAEGKHYHKVKCPDGHIVDYIPPYFCPKCGKDLRSAPTVV